MVTRLVEAIDLHVDYNEWGISMAASGLYRIVYTSRASSSFNELELRELTDSCSGRNAAAGVTGLLLFDGERFIQALEGPEEEVVATMDRIEADPRHASITYLHDAPVSEQQFGDWAMQFKRAPDGCCSDDFLENVKENVRFVEDPHLRAAFIGFAVLGSHRPRGYTCSR